MSTKELRYELIDMLSPKEQEAMFRDWPVWSREQQRAPLGNWRTWLMLGGRGAGKTRSGAEWIRAIADKDSHLLADAGGRIALIGETYHDVRSVMIEGESGILALHRRDKRPSWHASRRLLEWPSGIIGQVFSANDPDGLRGNQFGAAWCDEMAKWPYLEMTWSMLQFCLRLGKMPQQMVTTTPRPLRLLKKLLNDDDTVVTRMPTGANRPFLAPGFLDFINNEYGGTHLGRQEIDGEIMEDREDALWHRSQLELLRTRHLPELKRIIVAVDPPVTATARSDACGIIVAGMGSDGIACILEDATIQGVSPQGWAQKVVAVYNHWHADCVVAEVNQGGDMVGTVLAMIDPLLPVQQVHASRGKWIRAEPVALLYARGMVRHVGSFQELEDQMCNFGPDGLSSNGSPDRLDALVWALHELLLKHRGEPRIRSA